MSEKVKMGNWVNLILGMWLFLSPWFLITSEAVVEGSPAIWNFWMAGLAVAFLSGLALNWLRPWEEWTNAALGIWVFFSAWMFAMPNTAFFWNAVIVGLLVTGFAIMALPRSERSYQRVGR